MKKQKGKAEIYFVTNNHYKFEEFRTLLAPFNIELRQYTIAIKEIQTDDMRAIIIDKTTKAFEQVMRPVLVDHSGLSLECLEGMPMGLTQLFWDKLKGDKICSMATSLKSRKAKAVTFLGFCDGKNIYTSDYEKEGQISDVPKGTRAFQWDTIFIPQGHSKTYSEMDLAEKNKISQRGLATKKLFKQLKQQNVLVNMV